jgi:hypothetical protein
MDHTNPVRIFYTDRSFSFSRKKTEPKESARVTSPPGSPVYRRAGRTRRNSPCLPQGSDSLRVYFARHNDALAS